MLAIIFPFAILITTAFISPLKWLWTLIITQSFLISLSALIWFLPQEILIFPDTLLALDNLSSPLAILSCWLLPLTFLASQSKLSKEPEPRQRTYIATITALQAITVMAFLTTNLMLFFILFEATLIPTLIVITRWGAQKERLTAGLYLIYYTLTGSIPLLVALLFFYHKFGTLSISLLSNLPIQQDPALCSKLWWIACYTAFLMKIPMYGLHLWLPKAHVEAPIAGSMLLAGTLLKLGGYGMMRVSIIIPPHFFDLAYPLILLSLWGVVMTSALCLRQTDLKSLIAFSSVSHMGLVIAASMIQTPWSFTGALILMISHGLSSSALFCLANTAYERTNSRTLLLLRGTQTIFPMAGAWWLYANLFNMALPPSINFMGEMAILTSLFQWSNFTLILTGLNAIFTTTYSLYVFWTTQRGPIAPHLKIMPPFQTREHLLMALHILPPLLIILKPSLVGTYP
uniref:NADH-ubiquinone oxidoreductase chain 4 n=1 Tax=Heleophryne regis TaxID=143568 RepID=K9JZ97_HELRE|nr:NADH dehydrogenase subunit 4 [Heleophryne regis]AEC33145.1 NADH dehydrogenase subunit 4 [Heleophryne regis]